MNQSICYSAILFLISLQTIFYVESTSASSDGQPNQDEQNILYYGWFLDNSTANSLDEVTAEYLAATLTIPEVSQFMESVSQNNNVSDPLTYFTKPLDPNTLEFDPFYHITAKFCGSPDIDCTNYTALVENSIGKDFKTELIGVYFTERTFGVRVRLSPSQEILFEPDGDFRSKLRGIEFEPEDPNTFPPSMSRAHITLGCAPGVQAVVTGLDLVEIIQNELKLNDTIYEDFPIDSIGNLRRYGKGDNTSETAFVLYLDNKMIVQANFQAYVSVPSSG